MGVVKGAIPPSVLTGAHKIDWQVMVYCPNGRTVRTQVDTGSVTITGRDRGRTRGQLEIVDDGTLWDRTGETGVSPYGGSVKVQARVGSDLIDVAGGLVLEVERSRPGSTIDVAFVDYGAMLGWCELVGPIGINAGHSLADWITNFCWIAGPTGYVYDPGVPATVPTSFVEQGSHESGLAKLCTDDNIVVWLDEKRRVRVQPADVLDSTPAVWTFADGENGTIVTENHSLSRDGVPAAVVVTGETPQGAQAPVTGQAYQSTGPTRWGGPYGYVRQRANRPVLNSQAAADAAARTILDQQRRLKRQVDLTAVTHPGLEPGDRVDVVSAGERFAMVLQAASFRLSPNPMGATLVQPMTRANSGGALAVSVDTLRSRAAS